MRFRVSPHRCIDLVAVHVIIAVLAWRNAQPGVFGAALSAVQPTQVALLSLWLALGFCPSPIKVLAAIMGFAALIYGASEWSQAGKPLSTIALLISSKSSTLTIALLTVATYLSAGRAGLRLCLTTESPSASSSEPRTFSLRQVFAAIAGISILFWGARIIKLSIASSVLAHQNPICLLVACEAIAVTGVFFLSAWATLGTRIIWTRSVVVAVVAVITGVGVAYCFAPIYLQGKGDYAGWTTMFACESALSIGTLLLVRACGFRLARS